MNMINADQYAEYKELHYLVSVLGDGDAQMAADQYLLNVLIKELQR